MDGVAERSGGANRAQWLAELASAIDEAQLVAWRLGASGSHSAEALDLCCRLEAARNEIAMLRAGGWRSQRNEIHPNRT